VGGPDCRAAASVAACAAAGAAFFATVVFTAAVLIGALFFAVIADGAFAAAFLPAVLSFRFRLAGSGVAFDGSLERFTGGFFAVPEDACKLTASFARATAAFAF